MMKNTTKSSMKFRRLVRELRPHATKGPLAPEAVAVAVLENLWQFAASSAYRGDVGKFSNVDIAEHIGWLADPDALIKLLAEERWLDPHSDPAVRLVIHDWADHAPTYIRGLAAKYGGFIVSSIAEKSGGSSREAPIGASSKDGPKGVSYLEPSTGPNHTTPNPGRGAGVFSKLTEQILQDDQQLHDWFIMATKRRKPVIENCENHLVMVFGAAERALEVGDNPPALFAMIVSQEKWDLISQEQDKRAQIRLKRLQGAKSAKKNTKQDSGPMTIKDSLTKFMKGKDQ
jgi:hypothetical protein